MTTPPENTDLPRALVSTIIKNKLAQQSGSTDDADKHKVNLNKDALLAFVESAKIFISYLTATANDICHESKRQIINVDDVFTALEDIEFGEFVTPLKEALDAFREESKEKNAKKAERTKKRKQEAEEQAQAEAEAQEAQEAEAQQQQQQQQDADPAAADGTVQGPIEEVEPVGAAIREEVMADAPFEPVPDHVPAPIATIHQTHLPMGSEPRQPDQHASTLGPPPQPAGQQPPHEAIAVPAAAPMQET